MAKRIIFSKKAELDLARIIEFNDLRNRSNTYSKKFFKELIKRLRLLLKQPFSGISTDNDSVLLLIWDNYYVFYKLDDEQLIVSTIYHQKENIDR